MNNQNRNKKKKGGGLWAVIAAVIIVFNMLEGKLDGRGWEYLLWRLRHNPTAIAAIATVVIVAVIVAVSVAITKAKGVEDKPMSRGTAAARRGGTSAHHSHDRIQGYVGAENEYEHWKKQLDSFLAAGLIDRKEYNALLERRKTSYLK